MDANGIVPPIFVIVNDHAPRPIEAARTTSSPGVAGFTPSASAVAPVSAQGFMSMRLRATAR